MKSKQFESCLNVYICGKRLRIFFLFNSVFWEYFIKFCKNNLALPSPCDMWCNVTKQKPLLLGSAVCHQPKREQQTLGHLWHQKGLIRPRPPGLPKYITIGNQSNTSTQGSTLSPILFPNGTGSMILSRQTKSLTFAIPIELALISGIPWFVLSPRSHIPKS